MIEMGVCPQGMVWIWMLASQSAAWRDVELLDAHPLHVLSAQPCILHPSQNYSKKCGEANHEVLQRRKMRVESMSGVLGGARLRLASLSAPSSQHADLPERRPIHPMPTWGLACPLLV